MNNTDVSLSMAKQIAEKVQENGGRTFYVGGFVRDKILGRENKDIDIEIHGIPFERLQSILKELGPLDERKAGDNFGILALKGYDLDIAMPRAERATGNGGHKDFIIDVDPFIGYEAASNRRDFTINALMEDVLTGEILDFHGGLSDLENGVYIRHVNEETFKDDPLRVLRAAQFAARFNGMIAPETAELAKNADLTKLPKERVAGELSKALLKAEKPSIFFEELRKMDQLESWFPEVNALIGVNQDKEHHPEGDVFNHTMMVLDQAAELRDKSSNSLYFMVSALCHDFGKATATQYNEKKGKWQAIGHDKEGIQPASEFVKKIFKENAMEKYVTNMTELHMKPLALATNNSKKKKFMEMFDSSVEPYDLILLSKSDSLGRAVEKDFQEEKILTDKLHEYKILMEKPHVTGKTLIEMGYKPSPKFSEMLEFAHKCHLAEVDKDTTIKQIMGMFGKPEIKQKHHETDDLKNDQYDNQHEETHNDLETHDDFFTNDIYEEVKEDDTIDVMNALYEVNERQSERESERDEYLSTKENRKIEAGAR